MAVVDQLVAVVDQLIAVVVGCRSADSCSGLWTLCSTNSTVVDSS